MYIAEIQTTAKTTFELTHVLESVGRVSLFVVRKQMFKTQYIMHQSSHLPHQHFGVRPVLGILAPIQPDCTWFARA